MSSQNNRSESSHSDRSHQDKIGLTPDEAGKFLVVCIGASASGIKPLREFFERIPKDSGCAYVVILHLSPDFNSRLADILGAKAAIPVQQVTEPVKIRADNAYVIAPGMSIEITDGILTPKPIHNYEERHAPIDIFFHTLGDSSATDIEELQFARAMLAGSEERLRVTMDSAKDYAIITLSIDNIIEGWSAGAERIFGYTEKEAIGEPGSIIFTPEDIAAGAPEEELRTAIEEGLALDERWHMRRDGSRFYMSGVMRPISNPQLAGFVKVARDMTKQKLSDQLKDEFIGIASHELKTPVTSIKAYAELLEDMFSELGDQKSAGMIQKMDRQIDRLTDLIRSLLDVTRISQGRLEMRREHFSLDEILNEVRDALQHMTRHQLIVEGGAGGTVYADRERISQVLTNLISNAVRYSPDSDRVIISTKPWEDKTVMICVQDFGIGMSDEIRSRAFDRFYRANEGIGNTYPGLGLGLYISAEIIHRHGGKIWVESTEGEGSVFCFTLPVD